MNILHFFIVAIIWIFSYNQAKAQNIPEMEWLESLSTQVKACKAANKEVFQKGGTLASEHVVNYTPEELALPNRDSDFFSVASFCFIDHSKINDIGWIADCMDKWNALEKKADEACENQCMNQAEPLDSNIVANLDSVFFACHPITYKETEHKCNSYNNWRDAEMAAWIAAQKEVLALLDRPKATPAKTAARHILIAAKEAFTKHCELVEQKFPKSLLYAALFATLNWTPEDKMKSKQWEDVVTILINVNKAK